MRQKPRGRTSSSEQIIRDIKRKTRKQYSAEEKIRIVLDGLRGEDSIVLVFMDNFGWGEPGFNGGGIRSIEMRNLAGWLGSLVFAVAMMCASVGTAQEINVDAAMAESEEAREEIIRANVLLTGENADEFWALYKEYRAELGPLQHDLINVVVEYSKVYTDISDAQATSLFDEWLTMRQQQTKIKIRYLEKFRSILSPKHAIRYAQIENKLDAVIEFDAARSIPLVE